MALENSLAQYTIRLTREGTGAVQATSELQSLNQTMERSAISANHASVGFHQLHAASQTAKASFHEFHTVGLLLGDHLPVLQNSLMAVQGGMHATSSLAKTAGANIGIAAAAVAGLVAILHSAAAGWEAYKAKQEEAESFTRAAEGADIQGKVLEKHIALLLEQGRLTQSNAEYLKASIADDPRMVTNQLRAIEGTKQEAEAFQKLRAMRDELFEHTLSGYEKERYAAGRTYDEEIKKVNDLIKAGGKQIPEPVAKGFQDLTLEGYKASLLSLKQKHDEAEAEADLRIETERTAAADRAATEGMAEMERLLTIDSLQGSQDRVKQAATEYQTRLAYYQELMDGNMITEQRLTALQEEASIKRLQLLKKEEDHLQLHVMTIGEMEKQAAEQFSSSFTQAFDDFASGTKSAGDAFREFASSFLKEIGNMIMETSLLALIRAIAGIASSYSSSSLPTAGTSGNLSEYSGDFSAGAMATGGVVFAANGLAGVGSVSRPTYFPRFNVVAGEAGREMLTVLARPRMMSIGGVQSVVGQAGANTLAISNAASLAARGTGGRVVIEIVHSEASEARIIESSIQGAELRVTKRMKQSSPLRDAVKRVTK